MKEMDKDAEIDRLEKERDATLTAIELMAPDRLHDIMEMKKELLEDFDNLDEMMGL